MKARPQRDWAERAAARLYSAMLPHFAIVDKCEAQIARALRRAEKRGYAKGFAAALQTPKQRWKARERDRSEG